MHAMELSKSLPSAEELLRAIGLQRTRTTSDFVGSMALFGAGMLVGAGLALLFAPSSGAEMREQLGSRLGSVREQLGEKAEQARRTAASSVGAAAHGG
ncbi:MAG TPA: YtxH domain-containing protein [Candidatus Binatia bacterium]